MTPIQGHHYISAYPIPSAAPKNAEASSISGIALNAISQDAKQTSIEVFNGEPKTPARAALPQRAVRALPAAPLAAPAVENNDEGDRCGPQGAIICQSCCYLATGVAGFAVWASMGFPLPTL
jgi:hypothetical protein